MNAINNEINANLRHNLFWNLADGAFFGLAIGLASFVTVIPLFVSSMTASAMLIGLIPTIHSIGWQLPQLFTVTQVNRQKRYKPMVMVRTLHERLPFLGLAIVAWNLARVPGQSALIIAFGLLVWQGLGAGFAATAWQSMIAKIFPKNRRGTFYGTQAAIANLLASLGAVLAGFLLDNLIEPLNFTVCFGLAFVAMLLSWWAFGQTREPDHIPIKNEAQGVAFWSGLRNILKRDRNFRWFLVGRAFSQFAIMGSAFYSVYTVSKHQLTATEVGWMTGLMMGVQIIANPVMGWLADQWSYRGVMSIGLITATLGSLAAWWAPGPAWFYLVFTLTGISGVAIWTITLSMTVEFGTELERPAYIGLANTLIAPANILAPLIGGWLADQTGYPAAFLVSAAGGVLATLVFQFMIKDPKSLDSPQDLARISV